MDEMLIIKGKAAFQKAVSQGCTIQDLISTGEKILGCPIVLSNINCFVWYSSKGMSAELQKTALDCVKAKAGYLGGDITNQILTTKGRNGYWVSSNDRYYFAFNKIQCRGRVTGYSYIISDQDFQTFTLELHRCFCNILGDLMVKHDFEKNFLLLSEEEAHLIKILDDKYSGFGGIGPRLIFTGQDGLMELVVVKQRENKGGAVLNHAMIKGIRAALKCKICFSYGCSVIALLECGVLKNRHEAFHSVLESYDLVAGVSLPADNMDGIKTAYRQAKQAIYAIPDCLHKRLLAYAEIMLKVILASVNDKGIIRALCNSNIFILLEYDRENSTSLAYTLYIYLINGKKTKKVSEALGIHRNTVLARLNKIRELTPGEGVFMADGFFTLEFARYLYDLNWL